MSTSQPANAEASPGVCNIKPADFLATFGYAASGQALAGNPLGIPVGAFTYVGTATVPVLHGDDDQIVPYADAGPLSAKLLKNGTLKTYKGFPHGMPTTQANTINADLLAFLKA
jgi:pimeloyl-ACP methyl ester carboxylesterase